MSLRVGLQMLRPREVAWAHRHDEPVIWLDAIDTPFVGNMNAIFYEQYSSMKQPFRNSLLKPALPLPAGYGGERNLSERAGQLR